jgi:phage tail tape-measure protein
MGGRLGAMGRGVGKFALPLAAGIGVYDLAAGISTGNQEQMISGGGTLGGMAVGAAIGSVVPGVGTAVGAGIGGLVGWLGSMVVNSARSSDSSSSAIVDQLVMMRREQKQGFSDLAGNV